MNTINIISPYKHHGVWVFDNARVGLAQEPFVAGAGVARHLAPCRAGAVWLTNRCMMDPHIPWLAVLGASLVAGGALILISRGDQRGIPWLGLLGAALIAIVALVGAALAEPLPVPVPKPPGPGGSCPHGYMSSGSYCVPSAGAQDAISKPPGPGGSCPWGWTASGSYCLQSGSTR
jgi:hypothetical protein